MEGDGRVEVLFWAGIGVRFRLKVDSRFIDATDGNRPKAVFKDFEVNATKQTLGLLQTRSEDSSFFWIRRRNVVL